MDDLTTVIELNETATKLLLRAVNKYIEKWPGGNPIEQTSLLDIQRSLQAAVLEYNFHNSDERTQN